MGLFDGLGKFGAGGGGLLGGAHDFLMGTTPELAATGGGNVGPAPDGQMIKAMPQLQETGRMTGGLLDRIKEPDKRGLTFGDKLFAAGSVLQGDSGGAASYIANQRAAAEGVADRERQQQMAQQGLEALRGAIDPATGQLDYRKYLAALPAGGDPTAGLKVREGLRPDLTPMSMPGGGIRVLDRDKGAWNKDLEVQGEAGEPPKFIPGPDGQPIPNPVYGQYERMIAAERRAGAPPVGRSGGGRGKPSKWKGSSTQQLIDALTGG